MRRHLAIVLALPTVALAGAATAEASWVFRPSYYSHELTTGERVSQYAASRARPVQVDPSYLESGYRHNRFAIRGAGGSVDRMHVVQTWGAGEAIRPYGEWQRPFRAGATPYGPWGNPQGPWTSPFGSWVNPYGLGQIHYSSWGPGHHGQFPPYHGYPPAVPYASPGGHGGYGPGGGYPPGGGHGGGGAPGGHGGGGAYGGGH